MTLMAQRYIDRIGFVREDIQDSVIGWMKVYNFKGIKEGQKVDNKIYSAAQLSLCDSFANWMQASYIPKGGLGDVKKSVTEKLGLYNQHTAGLPQSYGAYSKIYFFLKYNSAKKFVPQNNLGISWDIRANEVPTDWAIRDICTPTQFYFTLPSLGDTPEEEIRKKRYDLTKIENLKPYLSFILRPMSTGQINNVLLCKNNKSPFIKLTKGEYLQLWETAIPVVYAREKKKIYEKEQGNQRNIDYFMKYLDEKNERLIANLKKTKEKYKDRLSELALISAQPSIENLDNANDIFSNGYLTDPESTSGRIPVYKIDPVMAELCKKDKPQRFLLQRQIDCLY